MRKLNGQDAFDMARLMKKANLKETMRDLFQKGREENASVESVGIEFITSLFFACAEDGVDKDFFKLIGNITGKTQEEVSQTPIEDLIEIFRKISEENNLSSFFKLAANFSK